MHPGSMGLCREIYQEGLRIPPVRNVRTPEEHCGSRPLERKHPADDSARRGDLMSQIGACRVGEIRLHDLIGKYGISAIKRLSADLIDYSERLMRAELAGIESESVYAEDFLDNDGFNEVPVRIRVAIKVLLKALAQALPDRIPSASSGTMNNLTIGGVDARTGKPFAYYETIAGGMGARPNADGISGIHTHMTNSLNTPVEALEYAYPFRVRSYSYRPNSGGSGQFRGGDGIIREIELLSPAKVTMLMDRRIFAPYGLAGGSPGALGRSILLEDGKTTELPGKCSFDAAAGAVVRVETPGGGGWGTPGCSWQVSVEIE
jgi:N-methylhydantoinase B/oxoprolinase/acetone carboxylase alpha subunit